MGFAGDVVRLARIKAGLTQRELAQHAGTSPAAIAFYETGDRDPTLDTLARVCRAAGFDLRIRLEPPDGYSESLDAVLEEHYGGRDSEGWQIVAARWADEARDAAATQ